MCWTVVKHRVLDKPREETAKCNIPIFKVCRLGGDFVISYFTRFPYKKEQLYHIPKLMIINLNYAPSVNHITWGIHEGFHSYSNKCSTCRDEKQILIVSSMYQDVDYPGECVIVKGYIPKGAHYYKNDQEEIVSNQIVLTEIVD